MEVKIYCLYNPQNLKIRYIGRTKSPLKKRLSQHLTKVKYFKKYTTNNNGSHLINWINSLLKDGIKPKIKLLTVVEGWKFSHKVEKDLIVTHFKKHSLVNGDDRGSGNFSKNPSQKASKKRIKNLKKYYSEEENKVNFYSKIYCYTSLGMFYKEYKSSVFACRELKIRKEILANHVNRFDNYNMNVNPLKGYYFSKYKKERISVTETYQSNHVLIKVYDKKQRKTFTFKTMKNFSSYYNLKQWDILQYRKNIYTKKFKKLLEQIEIINAPYS